MKYIFFGSPQFAVVVLEKLIAVGISPALVVCNPDKPVGRKKVLTPPLAKEVALRAGIPVWQPERLDVESVKAKIAESGAEFGVVAAYAKILRDEVIGAFPKGIMGIHPSLLPLYRGASPIQSAILNGERESGVTLFMIDQEIDHGPILATVPVDIENDSYEEAERKLAQAGAKLLVGTVPKFLSGELQPIPQNHDKATLTKKFSIEDGEVGAREIREAVSGANEEKAAAIDRKIRALNPEPGVWAMAKPADDLGFRGFGSESRRIKLLGSSVENGKLVLRQIQLEGKSPVNIHRPLS